MSSVFRLLRLPVDFVWLTLDLCRLFLWAGWTRGARLFGAEAGPWGPFCAGAEESAAAQAPLCPVARKYGSIGVIRALCPAASVAESGERVCTYQGDYENDAYVPYWGRAIGTGLALLIAWSAIGVALMHDWRRPATHPSAPVVAAQPPREPERSEVAPEPIPTSARRAAEPDPPRMPAAGPREAPQPDEHPAPEAATASTDGKVEKFITSGDRYFGEEQYLEALIEYKNAAQRDPSNAPARFGIGQCYLRLGRGVRDARFEFRKAVELDPAMAEAYAELCRLALVGQDLKRAAEHAKKLKALKPNDPEAALLLATCLDAGGDPEAALKEIGAAAERDGAAVGTFVVAGDLHLNQGQLDEAERAYRRALSLEPDHRTARVGLACALRRQGRLDQAEHEVDAVLEDDPQNPLAAIELAELQVARREVSSAIKTLEELTRREPKLYDSRARLAELLISTRRADAGVAVAKQVLAENPRHVESHLVLAGVFMTRGFHTMALGHCDKVLAADRSNVPARMVRARVYMAKRRREEAVRELTTVLQTAPEHFAARMLLGQAYLTMNQLDRAKECFETVARQYPKSPAPHLGLGEMQVEKGLPEAAILHYEEARRRAPDSPIALNNIASLLLDLGRDLDRAYQLASDVEKRFPGFPEGSDTYGWACYKRGEYGKAVESLAFAAQRLPRWPDVRYHYGMALYKTGKAKAAKAELAAALKLSGRFTGAAEAKATLAKIGK